MASDLFLRSGEPVPGDGNGPRPGVMVTVGDGRRAFVPGGTPELAMALARAAVPADVLNAPSTVIEFGTAAGAEWTAEKTIKRPPGG